jgi:hypothetical protein
LVIKVWTEILVLQIPGAAHARILCHSEQIA